MACDKFKDVKGFAEFFKTNIYQEKVISSLNKKLNAPVRESIRYEFYESSDSIEEEDDGKKEPIENKLPERGLYSANKIMAYVFVFDYNDEITFSQVLDIATSLTENELNHHRGERKDRSELTKEDFSIKIFIGNKYPHLLDNEMSINLKNKVIYPVYEIDLRAKEILKEIMRKKIFLSEEEAKENIFFCNAKYNIGVQNAFSKVYNQIHQNDDLYRAIAYDKREEYDSDEDNELLVNPTFFERVMCCGGRKKSKKEDKVFNKDNKDNKDIDNKDNNKLEHVKDEDSEAYTEVYKFHSDEEEDANQIPKQNNNQDDKIDLFFNAIAKKAEENPDIVQEKIEEKNCLII
jgi:hypothetical protein